MRREREWAYKPALVLKAATETSGSRPFLQWRKVVVSNIGTGPAFNVRLAVHQPARDASDGHEAREHQWRSAEWPGLPAGGEVELAIAGLGTAPAEGGPRPDRHRAIVDDVQSLDGEAVYAVRYDDWFDNHYRVVGPAIRPAEEYRGHTSEVSAPDWARVS
jgi:hypothetical protein